MPDLFTVVVTGSRDWTEAFAIRTVLGRLLDEHEKLVVHVGDARGADLLTKIACRSMGIPVVVHEADWKQYGRAAGPLRNRSMLDTAKPDLVAAFPLGDSRGTRGCMALAQQRGIPVREYDAAAVGTDHSLDSL